MQVSNVTRAAMDLTRAPSASAADEAFAAVRALGLEQHLAEIEGLGFTIIPPELAGTGALAPQLLQRICEISEQTRGQWPDTVAGATHADPAYPVERQEFLLAKGRVFEQALMNPVVQAMVRYLVGEDAVLSTCVGRIRGPGVLPLMLHTDQAFHPVPLPLVCNINFLLSDYSRENGALCFVPGSHRLQRNPLPEENFYLGGLDRPGAEAAVAAGEPLEVRDPPGLHVVEAPAGSLAVWPGNTWHGALARSAPGLRFSLILYFCNKWLRPQEAYRECLPQEILDRNDERFARLVGSEIYYGWGPEGTEFDSAKAFAAARRRVGTI